MADPTFYEILGVSRSADRETIRKAYIAIARDSHPDRQVSTAKSGGTEARIRAANAAWNVLRDPVKRFDYDRSLPDPVRPMAPPTTQPRLEDHRPPPPSGILVSAQTAPLWKWVPVVVAVLIGAALFIGSAYATSQDSGSSVSSTIAITQTFQKGDCVVVTPSASGKIAYPVTCDKAATGVIDSVVDTLRPCPPQTVEYQLYDGKTTLCVVPRQ